LSLWRKVKETLFGTELNPFDKQIFRSIALVSFFAWIGLGADGLSSSCYGPPEAYLALNQYRHLAVYIALATAITVFVIALSYNQVIELFPNGGGGYRIATQLLHPYAGLISGAALIVDYALTITISVASGTDAIFSFLPNSFRPLHLGVSIVIVLALLILNLRGIKESIKFLLPVFMGFVVTHAAIIIYGFLAHRQGIASLFSTALSETSHLTQSIGWLPVLFLLLHSYSLGAGTYTGLEAVSNNVHRLAEPHVRTGKWTMAYIAISLSFTACGLMLLYLLYDVNLQTGETLNATTFHHILGGSSYGQGMRFLLLLFEAGLLFVAANTGFIAGPATLGNMAMDSWVPGRFRHLSNRLVMQNSLIVFGIGAILLLYFTKGSIQLLVVLYSINVFITFTLSLLGLCKYWWHNQLHDKRWRTRLPFSILAFLISLAILLVMILTKFLEGGWVTLLLTISVLIMCLFIKRHYRLIDKKLKIIDANMTPPIGKKQMTTSKLDPNKPTAVFFVPKNRGIAMHTLLDALHLFPNRFSNFVFVGAGVVDIQSFQGEQTLEAMQREVENNLNYFVKYSQQRGYPAEKMAVYDTELIRPLVDSAGILLHRYKDCTFFAGKLILEYENWFTRLLYNETSVILQRHIFAMGKQLIILPTKV
jgi:amino acid transporter